MTLSRTLPIALLAAGAAVAQPAPPAPPATPPPAAVAPVAPVAPTPPTPPDVYFSGDDLMFDLRDQMRNLRENFHLDTNLNLNIDVQDQVRMAREQAEMARDQVQMARDVMQDMRLDLPMFAQATPRAMPAPAPMPPMPPMRVMRYNSVDRAYEAGQRSLEARRYGDALEAFNQVVARGGNRADGALYWKAYALIKLGRADEARAAIAELRKSYASSRWLDDAKVLEVEAGKPVTPESESDEDLKLIALNGLMQSDPDRALPLVDGLLKSSQPPTIKRKALFVLAQSNTPKGQQVLEQVARGQGNPDLQVAAIRYLGERRRQGATAGANPVLAEIYSSTNDPNVKRAILTAYESARDKDRLLQVAKTEHDNDLRMVAIRELSSMQNARDEVWSLYNAETNAEIKQQILSSMPATGNAEKFLEVARTEKDPKLRRFAVMNLGSTRAATTGDSLASLYSTEQDPQVKRTIIDALGSQKNVKAMVQIARSEKDARMQQQILERLVSMKSPEANDYLMEIIKK